MLRMPARFIAVISFCVVLSQCGETVGTGNMRGPTPEARAAKIASEPTGDFFYGRRYYVYKTRFWGYLRKPREPWSRAKLVVFNESKKTNPDRFSESGPPGQRYAFDQNFEYRIRGNYTGRQIYEPNSNQFLPEFMLTGYEVVDKDPGWLFRQDDRYDPMRITLYPR